MSEVWMPNQNSIREKWLRPFIFYGNNRLSLLGGAVTTASALVLIGFWVVGFFGHGGSSNPYLGIIFDLILPGIFVAGLVLILVGVLVRRSYLLATHQIPAFFPEISLNDPIFRRGLDFVLVGTFLNFIIVGTASYRGVAYMDTPNFCGQSCHVMAPQFSAYRRSPHASVACVECHVAPGVPGYLHAKVNGTKQLFMVISGNYPRPILAEGKIPPPQETCLNCHNSKRLVGDKLVVKSTYSDDEKNSVVHSLVLLHVGGRDQFGKLSGIHGAHLGQIEFISTDSNNQTIPWVGKKNDNGSLTEFALADTKGAGAGQRHVMDCIDCHNRAAHSFETPEEALDKDMAAGTPDTSLPFAHKEGLALIKSSYASQEEATTKITAGFEEFFRSKYPSVWNEKRKQVDQGAKVLAGIYDRNVFPYMNVAWGTHPNNLGHNDYPGCFRCHDGNHNAKDGKSITNDCATCHNLVAIDEPNPKQLSELGMQ
jgi:nitrate/TMAO reductase-like tetraheme cytochrome c subunit